MTRAGARKLTRKIEKKPASPHSVDCRLIPKMRCEMRKNHIFTIIVMALTVSVGLSTAGSQRALVTERIVFTSLRDGYADIYVMNADGTNQTRVTNNPDVNDFYPAFSPDGSKIAFTSDRESVSLSNGIYVMNADGTNQTLLTKDSPNNRQATFSPNGSKIAYSSYRGSWEIYVMNADGTNPTPLTNNAVTDSHPSFSPNGSKITFYSDRDGNPEIYVMNADGTSQTRLTDNSAGDFDPSFSPDGSQIVFISDRHGTFDNLQIYVMNADGTNPTRLTSNSGNDFDPSFSPDGSEIAFYSDRDGRPEIYVMNADGTNETRLTNNVRGNLWASWGHPANHAPQISGSIVNVEQNSFVSSHLIATVSDDDTPTDGLTVSVIGALPAGVSVANITINEEGQVQATVSASCASALGNNAVALQVSDGSLTQTGNLIVNVTPSMPATINLKAFTILYPPNHEYRTITIDQMIQSATDDCDGNIPGNVVIERATSDEAENGGDDGNTRNDIVIADDCKSVRLRSERNGIGNGRVYNIVLVVTDTSGNLTKTSYKAFVRIGNQMAIEDPALYSVSSMCAQPSKAGR